VQFIDSIPIWFVFCAFVVNAFCWIECGFRFGQYRKSKAAHEPESAVAAMIASTLALLAFVLGFTFNIATSRFEERRILVVSEANAVGTAYLRADCLDEPSSSRIKALLRKYVEIRIDLDSRSVPNIISTSEQLQHELWKEATIIAKRHSDSPVCALFISALNEVIDIHSRRVTAGLYARVPIVVWLCLFLVSSLAMTGLGFLCGILGHRSYFATSTLVAAFGAVMILVADLDRPLQGVIRTPQQALTELYKKL
jgi:hypothetical protein